MDEALSLKSGQSVRAERSTYQTQRDLLLVCPECKEPVHLRKRRIPNVVSYFAHPERSQIDSDELCTLRVIGGWHASPAAASQWDSKGQLIRRFQLEFASYFVSHFSTCGARLLKSLTREVKGRSQLAPTQFRLLEELDSAGRSGVYPKIRFLSTVSSDQGREIAEAYATVLQCLTTHHARAAAIGLSYCALLGGYSAHIDAQNQDCMLLGVQNKDVQADLAVQPRLVLSYLETAEHSYAKNSYVFRRSIEFAQFLIIRILISWRHPTGLVRKNFLISTPKAPPISSNSRSSMISLGSSIRKPVIRTPKQQAELDRLMGKNRPNLVDR
jgi:hypothetical protein